MDSDQKPVKTAHELHELGSENILILRSSEWPHRIRLSTYNSLPTDTRPGPIVPAVQPLRSVQAVKHQSRFQTFQTLEELKTKESSLFREFSKRRNIN